MQRFRSTPHLRAAHAITNFAGERIDQGAIGMSPCTDELKLVALDKDDIEVISAHVQDSLVRIADILWRPSEHRFVIALNRFDWMSAAEIAKAGKVPAQPQGPRPSRTTGAAERRCASNACWPANAAISIKLQRTRSLICLRWNSPKPIRRPASCP